MTAYWISYLVVALLLGIIRVAIDDGARDHRIAWIFVTTCCFTLLVLFACRRCT